MKIFAIPLLIATASSLTAASSLCPLNNTPKCCTVEGSDLFPTRCVELSTTPTSAAELNSICKAQQKEARCCVQSETLLEDVCSQVIGA
ncbi:uncharacterized protein BO88DRAFT_408838 [Aspergillus vadensis CBS 113365]|uniref:Hydrophobin n=1 Tax=Aspergillus vadensis (strain CBS 113365 / IMI 142717 / IBT 24658) TaxID=1448311 RepID=A0A319C4X1_ASPVC|nr:hypothetical protein BO88DRAFT_408838 [Aspergillus vadensis CBS 113365]PYH63832.1 hypothetical protein BO88DRAFT_408838 [Aspergillus vadensis CBS 113365]